MPLNDLFRKFASRTSKLVGSTWAFLLAIIFVGGWMLTNMTSKFTDQSLLWISTVCTLVTFLIVFLIQNTQNRHNRAMQLKLDELIKSQTRARNDLVGLEEFTDAEMDIVQNDFHELRQEFVDRQAALIKHHMARRHDAGKK